MNFCNIIIIYCNCIINCICYAISIIKLFRIYFIIIFY